MGKIPEHFIQFFFIGMILSFLMINYDFPLASIYSHLAVWLTIAYLVPLLTGAFKFLPITQKGKVFESIVIGVGTATGFVLLFNNAGLQSTLAQVFAATAFGESHFLGQLVFGGPIPLVETLLFFWVGYEYLKRVFGFKVLDFFSTSGQIITIGISAAFLIFHATAKGVTNNQALLWVGIFAYISMFLIIYFKRALDMIVFHVSVNSVGVGLWEAITSFTSVTYIFAGVAVLYYLLKTNKIPTLN